MVSDSQVNPQKNGQTRQMVIRWLSREICGVIMVGAILFLSAWRLDWLWGWLMVAAVALWVAGMAAAIIPHNPGLLAERLRPKKGTKTWDQWLMGLVGLSEIARYLVAGFDNRLGWSLIFPTLLQAGSYIPLLAGFGLVVWATAANAFFSLNVRIQTERNQQVISTGPYRFIRHPGYTGTILSLVAAPLLLGSWWALIPSAVGITAMIFRTFLEDRTLQAGLSGYAEYSRLVRYRLLPGIW